MTYLRALFFNFLVVFFVNRVIPGIDVGTYDQVQNVGGDLFIAVLLGFFNSLIYPAIKTFGFKPSTINICLWAFIITFGIYGVVGLTHFGIHSMTFGGYFLGSLIIMLVSIFSNYLEREHSYRRNH